MNQSLDKSLYYLTGNGNLETVTVEELEKLADDHPYFTVTQFLLSKKLNSLGDKAFLPQVQKTALYFPNPYWLHYQLLNDIPDEPIVHENSTPTHDLSSINEPQQIEKNIDTQVAVATNESTDNTTKEAIEEDEHPITEQFSLDEIESASQLAHVTLQESTVEINDADGSEEFIEPSSLNFTELSVADEKNDSLLKTDAAFDEGSETVISDTEVKQPVDSIPQSSENEEHPSQAEEEMTAVSRDTSETAEQFLDELEEQTPTATIQDEATSAAAITTTEISTNTNDEFDEHEKMFQNIKAMLDASAEEANADIKNAAIPIDPYYTIDYFASQGIKLEFDKNPDDKLGKQVKKFTQWLKHMKKLGPEDAIPSDTVTEGEVEAQKIADNSNINREVVTEAMALVLEKQGKKDKATELYRKLSFLNPNKSAYFAAKIKNLNGT